MGANLQIDNGPPNAWWLSPDIWTVPGDPNGLPGLPIVGKPCYVYARIHNRGDATAYNAAVRFWWGNPAAGVTRDPGKLIGNSSATVNPEAASPGGATVLCLQAWIPAFVNDGHECLVVEVAASTADLPSGPDFNIPNNPQAAQRNLNVVMAAAAQFHFAFEVANGARVPRTFTVLAREGDLGEIRGFAGLPEGLLKSPGKSGTVKDLGFVEQACPTVEQMKKAKPKLEGLKVGPNERRGFSLVGSVGPGPALLHIEQHADGRVVGGVSVLAIPSRKE